MPENVLRSEVIEIVDKKVKEAKDEISKKIEHLEVTIKESIQNVEKSINNLGEYLKESLLEKQNLAFHEHTSQCEKIREKENQKDIETYFKKEVYNPQKEFIARDFRVSVVKAVEDSAALGAFKDFKAGFSRGVIFVISGLVIVLILSLFSHCPAVQKMYSNYNNLGKEVRVRK